ncbi:MULTISPECIES: Ig-like domain-containing protein [Bhargavaea]|uniref:Ig-like domain-containing protein n=1 Tax=Bhargavaea changchunensis TaxID=2134037 RepID=A0ABW2N9J8_9BACL|nr:Ig-like domain-containing protein [Bhargavaea sp. CC-171006]
MASVMATALLMTSMFGASAYAESPEELKEKIQLPGEVKPNQELLDKINLKPFNLNQFNTKNRFNQESGRSVIEKAAEDDVFYEVEPNDDFYLADNLPLLSLMVANMDYGDLDIFKVKVTTAEEYLIVMGLTDEFEFPVNELIYGVVDSNYNFIEPELYEYEDGLSYQVVPVKKGDYYILAFDYYGERWGEYYFMMAGMLDVIDAPKVNAIDDNDKVITGKSEKGSTVKIYNGKTMLGSQKVDSKGNFKINIKPIKAGTKIKATATDQDGYESKPTTITVADKTAPASPKVNAVDDNDKTVSGKTEANATVTVKNGKTTLGTPKADKSGNFKLSIKPVKAGTKLTFTAKDSAGNVSKASTKTVVDKTAPSLTVKDIYSGNKSVAGKTEAGAKVTVKVGKTTLGSGTANTKGEFKITIKAQKKNTTVTISASDKAKNTKTVSKKVK